MIPEGWHWFNDGSILVAVPPDSRFILARLNWHVTQARGTASGDVTGIAALVEKLDDHEALVRLAHKVFRK